MTKMVLDSQNVQLIEKVSMNLNQLFIQSQLLDTIIDELQKENFVLQNSCQKRVTRPGYFSHFLEISNLLLNFDLNFPNLSEFINSGLPLKFISR